MNAPEPSPAPPAHGPSLHGHLEIARTDHWIKNVFVVPGILAALSLGPTGDLEHLPLRLAMGLLAVCLVASSNYVLNEVLDAPFDRHHPRRCRRAVPSGRVSVPFAYGQWLGLMGLGVGLGLAVSLTLGLTLLAFWGMGIAYNVPPVRTKELPYLDVLSEAVNNPLRMVAGWYMVAPPSIPPASLLLSYWLIGAYFMAMKRYAELRHLGDPQVAAKYRRSFRYYTTDRLLVSIMFYASAAMLFFGAFIMRYRLELILSFPLVAAVMAVYLALAFKPDSAVQAPERLYREPLLMVTVGVCAVVMTVLLYVDIPFLYRLFLPTAPLGRGAGM